MSRSMSNLRPADAKLARALADVFAQLKATVPSWEHWAHVPVLERDRRGYVTKRRLARKQDNKPNG